MFVSIAGQKTLSLTQVRHLSLHLSFFFFIIIIWAACVMIQTCIWSMFSHFLLKFPRYLCPVYRDLQLLIVTLFMQFTMLFSILMPCSVFDYWKSYQVLGKQDAFNLSECHSSCSHHVIVSFLQSGVSGYNFLNKMFSPQLKKEKAT